MRRSGFPAPDIPALAVIAVVLWCAPVAAELMARWRWEVPVRMVFLGW